MTKSSEPDLPPVPNAHYEALLRLRESNPTVYSRMSPNAKLAVLYYEAAKREKARLEAMHDEANKDLPPAA